MKKVLLPVVVVILLLVTAIGSFRFGVKTERRELNKALYSTQSKVLWQEAAPPKGLKQHESR